MTAHGDDGDGYCRFSDLPVDQCGGCLGHDDGDKFVPVETFGEMPARYSSAVACGHRVKKGDTIYSTAEDEWICGSCSKSV